MKKEIYDYRQKRRRKVGRPRKPTNPIGAPKLFNDPVRVHIILEQSDLDRIKRFTDNANRYGNTVNRSDFIRFCIKRMIGDLIEG